MSTTYTTHIPLEVLQAYAVKHFLKDFAKLPPHTNCKTEKFGDQFKLRVGEARAISKFSKPYLKPEPVYAVVAGSGFELRREDATNSVISPHNVVFDAPFCYLYPHGVPYFSVRDLHIVLRYYFESFGQSVPVDPARSEFLLYAQQLRSACAKIADGQATGTEERESIAEGKFSIMHRALTLTSSREIRHHHGMQIFLAPDVSYKLTNKEK
ncbi:hypothetical protein ACJQWK_08952 [Exserohilum turcicum]